MQYHMVGSLSVPVTSSRPPAVKLISLAGEDIELSASSRHPQQVWMSNALGLCKT